MQTSTFAHSRVLTSGARRALVRQRPQIAAFTGFRRAGLVDGLGRQHARTLQGAILRVPRGKTMRVTKMMFERFTESA